MPIQQGAPSADRTPAEDAALTPRQIAARKRKVWRRHVFTPEMAAAIRHRYERTSESIDSISHFAKVSQQTIRRYAEEGGWTRFVASPRDIPLAAKLAAQAAQLAHMDAQAVPSLSLPPRSGGEGRIAIAPSDCNSGWGAASAIDNASGQAEGQAPPSPSPPFAAHMGGGENVAAPPEQIDCPEVSADIVRQLIAGQFARLTTIAAGIDRQIAVLRAKQMLPQSPDEVRENAGTLESLTAGASHIQYLLNAMPQGARADDSVRNAQASDLDARRDALAHRIESLVAEWLDAEDAAGAERD